jgi:hypothetical protein
MRPGKAKEKYYFRFNLYRIEMVHFAYQKESKSPEKKRR